MSKIVAVQKSGSEIERVKLDDGSEMSKYDLINGVMQGTIKLDNYIIAESSTGEPYIRAYPDGDKSNNLQNLPTYNIGEMTNMNNNNYMEASTSYQPTNNQGYNPNANTSGAPHRIVAVHKEGSDITQYKLENGHILDESQVIQAVLNGEITGYTIAQRDGYNYIRSYPDGDSTNNLGNLPQF